MKINTQIHFFKVHSFSEKNNKGKVLMREVSMDKQVLLQILCCILKSPGHIFVRIFKKKIISFEFVIHEKGSNILLLLQF